LPPLRLNQCEIGCEKSERYEYVPANRAHEIIRPTGVRGGKAGVSIAPLPPTLVPKASRDQPGGARALEASLSIICRCMAQRQFERLGR